MLFLNQKYIYEILIGSCEKAKVPCTGQPTMSAWSIYSWSRRDSFLTKELHGSTNYHRTKCDSAKLIPWHKSYKSEAKSNIGQLLLYDNYFFRFPILKLHLSQYVCLPRTFLLLLCNQNSIECDFMQKTIKILILRKGP